MLMSGAMLVARPSAKSTSSECRLRNPGNWDWQWSIRPRNRQRQFASAAPRNCIAQRRLGAGTAIGIGTIRTIRSGIHIITADTGTMGLAYGGTAAAAHRKRRANTTRTISPRQTRRRLRLRGTPILRWTRAAVDHPATRLDSGRLLQASFPWLIITASRENRHEISHIRPVGLESIGSWGTQNDADSIAALNRALDLGCNFIDTAQGYGNGRSERTIAQVLKQRRGRDKVYVATKIPPVSPGAWPPSPYDAAEDRFPENYLRERLERSLRDL